ncbi:ABC transporter ATP-binding protein [bacterium]|nr:ABC transporter ATP-binding protein [bacterium]
MNIVLRQISKSFHGRPVLENLDLKVAPGEFHVLLGPSGGGKTTMVSVIAGLTKPDSGSVLINDRDVSLLPPGKRKIGLVFQDCAIFPHLDVFDNIAYGLRVRKQGEANIRQKLKYYLEKTGLEKEKHKFPHQLSGGQKQRTALLRTLVTEPEVLLLDEPMSSLDILTREQISAELVNIQRKTGLTTIYVTHNQAEAFSLGDRISVLHNGKIEQIETPEELFYHPKTEFVARFVGINNILKAKVAATSRREAVMEITNEGLSQSFKLKVKNYPVFKKGEAINLCLHPEKINLSKKNAAIDGGLNRICGKIIKRTNHGNTFKVTVDIRGLALHAVIPKFLFNFQVYEEVWVVFAPDALHPLCGRRCRAPEFSRKCHNDLLTY